MDRQGFVIEADPEAGAGGCAGPSAGSPLFARGTGGAPSAAIEAVHAALSVRLAAQQPACGPLCPGGAFEADPVVAILAEAGAPMLLVAVPVALGSAAADTLFGGDGAQGGPPTPIAIAAAQARASALAALIAEAWAAAGRTLARHEGPADVDAFPRRYRAATDCGDVVLAYADGFGRGAARPAGLALAPAKVDLRAVIGTPRLTVADFAALAAGTTIPLDGDGMVTLISGGREIGQGEIVIDDARRAVRVTAVRP